VVDRLSGKLLSENEFDYVPGPAASERTARRLAYASGNRSPGERQPVPPVAKTTKRAKGRVRHD
jgi:hypothetical protein